ncbi:macrolide transport system ATP-binding/permease protein [Rathayibacter sp. PhB152]|uniref:ABC transporter ATP-binding protein/permease n=1 Tax=Rathayibacter sp. PhB152 TaxID=2485190 RepID=UPI000F4B2499|nr:ATP-binding cassette domain-containing protein [Rathayibacter sp. PhB152]ROQ57193.1 macrolide transport system ATP-binding/permease protein [Rathayibacter sp. PhB152]
MTVGTPPAPAALELTGITRTFGADPATGIRDIGVTVRQGEFVAIVGPSGSGKSTLLNVLGLLDTPTAGSYRVFGTEVASLRERERDRLRSRVFGFVFQQSFVLGDVSALHNAALGLRTQRVPLAERGTRALDALARLGVEARAHAAGRVLSGGEQQRLALARAIATRPRIVLADEPTGNLDRANGTAVLDYLRDLHSGGVTVVLITHDETIAAAADRTIRIVDGTVDPTTAASPRAGAQRAAEEGGAEEEGAEEAEPSRRSPHRWVTALADDLGDAVDVVTTRLARTLFLLLAFALGIGGLVASIGVSESASGSVADRLSAAALDEVRVTVPGGTGLLRDDDRRLSEWIASASSLPRVTGVGSASVASGGTASIQRLSPTEPERGSPLRLMSASSDYLRLTGASPVGPDTFGLLDDRSLRGIAIVGHDAAATLELPPPGPGCRLWVNGRTVDVVGVLDAGPRQADLTDSVIVSPDVLEGAADVATALLIRTEPGYPAAVAEAVPLRLDAANPGRFGVETVADLRDLRTGIGSDLGALIALISLILLLLATISAATTLHLSVQARAHEIALRRAVGASRTAVGRLFLAEGLLIGLLGGAVGVAVGSAATLVIAGLQGWTPVLESWLPAAGLGVGLLTGLAASTIPAWTASRQDPALALRAR